MVGVDVELVDDDVNVIFFHFSQIKRGYVIILALKMWWQIQNFKSLNFFAKRKNYQAQWSPHGHTLFK